MGAAPELATFIYSYGAVVISDGLITVEDAAKRLGISKKRVYGLAAAGALSPHPIGANRYLLDAAEVEARRAQGVVNGRPLDQRSAWAVLWLGLGRGDHDLGPWGEYLARNTRWRVRQKLGDGPLSDSLAALAPRLRNRAESVKLRAHPSDLRRLVAEPSLVRTGVSAAAEVGADVVAADEVEAYVPADDLARLREKFFLEGSRKPNVLLRVVQPPWPFPPDVRVAPATAVAVDLLDSTDERTRRAGRELLESLDRGRPDD
jgi:excisionase family DNA binding protein